ncbi:uncharacterized protein LOC143218861 isoform X2 [Lasioglossum baleicum]|uniref:uncharacterized protein LOC143218861 isoform X2 n=1 Tax=Lasioglossum baleicum TaxID=434251 RepID=UPI003FCE04C0
MFCTRSSRCRYWFVKAAGTLEQIVCVQSSSSMSNLNAINKFPTKSSTIPTNSCSIFQHIGNLPAPKRSSAIMTEMKSQLEYKLLTKDKIQEAMQLQAETMKQECLAIGLGMFEEPGAPEEIQLLFKEILKDGATIIAVDKDTDELAAVAFNKIHARPREDVKDELEVFIEENLKKTSCQELVKFLGDVETSVDIFEKYDADGAMELFYIGTNPKFQGRGIGSEMVKKCIEFARGLLNGTMKRCSIDNGGNESTEKSVPFDGGIVISRALQLQKSPDTMHGTAYRCRLRVPVRGEGGADI